MAEVLSRYISKLQEKAMRKGVSVHHDLESIKHSQFVDDTSLFGEETIWEVRVIKDSLEMYANVAGQQINDKKSEIFFFNTKKDIQVKISRLLGWLVGSLPKKYLGVPLFSGSAKTALWEDLISKYRQRVDAWKHKWPSLSGRIQLIKVVLSTMPIYAMFVLKLSSKAIQALESFLKKFLWEGAKQIKIIPLISWDVACSLKEEGGVGLRGLEHHILALGTKLIWKIYRCLEKL
ncbi:uncharacterized protein LOC131055615 [Cryptomeria japonica]|uniref:uncharacterized protein LOC131055615 n=1 Tax=Cryptomeria japonica TaxID=3369 RepID=UPI0027DA0C41|nr:uncharacterized protein LOC131055615 [Cryptomeria japonica]